MLGSCVQASLAQADCCEQRGACKQFIMWDGLGWALGNPESLSKLYALKFARSLLL